MHRPYPQRHPNVMTVTPQIKRLDSTDIEFSAQLKALLAWGQTEDQSIHDKVLHIISSVRDHGNSALLDYTQQFDRHDVGHADNLEIPRDALKAAWDTLPTDCSEALSVAAQRIREYAEHQKLQSWQYQETDGTLLGQQITALNRVGIYVPGGKAAYPSSVLMNAIPAKVAGVNEILMVTPTPSGHRNTMVLAAAHLAGVDRIFTIGGAQAIAALAYGTETIPAVDKIVGPGNIYVATAKKLVFGQVGIDMIAGPSEILIICDGQSDPDWIAMDLFSQAEHDENAQAILISPDENFLTQVNQSIKNLLPTLERAAIIRKSLDSRGAFIHVPDLTKAIEIANIIAPEHLELSVEKPELLAPLIHNAGAIFMGRYTAEALGDYCAGPNHVLPTSGTAKFSSPLGVYDFQKRTSLINCSASGADSLGRIASVLARGESLTAHAQSAEYRIFKESS